MIQMALCLCEKKKDKLINATNKIKFKQKKKEASSVEFVWGFWRVLCYRCGLRVTRIKFVEFFSLFFFCVEKLGECWHDALLR